MKYFVFLLLSLISCGGGSYYGTTATESGYQPGVYGSSGQGFQTEQDDSDDTVLAGCISDCKDEYESDIEDCQLLWGDDPDDDYMLQSCIDDGNSDYESCEEECTS